jgi:uncharacterized protein YkwD
MLEKLMIVLALGLAGEAPTEQESAEKAPKNKVEFALTETEQNMLNKTNNERVARGLPPLVIDPSLVESARQHANWMASMRTMRHTSKPVGENIAMGQSTSSDAVRTWMNSPPHRANMLSRSWNRIGAAAFTTPEGRIYWCLQFLR